MLVQDSISMLTTIGIALSMKVQQLSLQFIDQRIQVVGSVRPIKYCSNYYFPVIGKKYFQQLISMVATRH